MKFERFVALGDSTTEGLDDPIASPGGGEPVFRGWADRLAELLARENNPDLLYANLAVRGRLIAGIRETQLEPALAMQPDLASVVGGVNDLLRPKFDLQRVVGELRRTVEALRRQGATVMVMTLPDLSDSMRIARIVSGRLADFNQAIRELAFATGATLVDAGAQLTTFDPRGWSPDRLHANGLGHEYLMLTAASALGVESAAASLEELKASAPEPVERAWPAEFAAESVWAWSHLRPWVVRRIKGVSSGDGITAKRPELAPVNAADLSDSNM
jgi:lysophospholipase L1-like esterase